MIAFFVFIYFDSFSDLILRYLYRDVLQIILSSSFYDDILSFHNSKLQHVISLNNKGKIFQIVTNFSLSEKEILNFGRRMYLTFRICIKRKNPIDYTNCSIRIPDILAPRWKAWLIIEINKGISRPSDLHRSIAIAPKRALTKQLTELEEQGIVEKTIYPVLPLKLEYHLTDAGKELLSIIEMLEK